MRFLLKVSIPVESGNAAIRAGSIGEMIGRILKDIKPEAAYFAEENGQRTGFIVVNIQDAHQIPSVAEPWFLAFKASVEFHPAMTLEDLQKAEPDIARAVQAYG